LSVPDNVVMDDVVGGAEIKIDAGAQIRATVVMAQVVGDFGSVCVGSIGIDTSEIGCHESVVVDLVVQNAPVAGTGVEIRVRDAVPPGVVNGVPGNEEAG